MCTSPLFAYLMSSAIRSSDEPSSHTRPRLAGSTAGRLDEGATAIVDTRRVAGASSTDIMRRLIKIYDTTLRDGTQGEGVSFSMEDKVRLATRLDALGIHYIEGGWPGSNPKDLRFFRRMQDVTFKHAKLAAFSMTRRAGGNADSDANMQALLESGAPVATIVGKSWDFHVTAALGTTLAENVAMIADTIAFL